MEASAEHAGAGPGTVPPDPAQGFKRMLSELADLGAFGCRSAWKIDPLRG